MEEWKEYRLGDICDTISDTYKGNSPQVVLINTSDVLEGKCLNHIPVPNKNLKGQFKKTFCNEDILYSEIRPANKRFAYIDFEPKDYIASTKLMVIRSKEEVLPKYLYYILQSNQMLDKLQTLAETRSGTFPQITFSELAAQKIILPGLNSQKKIVQVLESINSKIELNRRINENLEQQAQALFNYYFIEHCEILGDYERGNLTEIANYTNGLPMQKFRPQDGENGIPVLKIKELGQGQTDNSSDICSGNIADEYKVTNGDIIFSWSGTLMIKVWCGGLCGLNQHLFKVTSEKYPKWYYYFWTKFHLNKFIRIAQDKAVTMGHIRRKDLESSEVLIPKMDALTKIGNIINPIFNQIIEMKCENNNLAEIRDTLLPKLMSGELKILDIDDNNLQG